MCSIIFYKWDYEKRKKVTSRGRVSFSKHTQNRENENENKLRINHSTDAIAVVTVCVYEKQRKIGATRDIHTHTHTLSRAYVYIAKHQKNFLLSHILPYNSSIFHGIHIVVSIYWLIASFGVWIFFTMPFEALNTLDLA